MLILEYSLTKEDYFNFNYYTNWLAPNKKSFRIIYWVKSFIYTLLACFVTYYLLNHTLSIKQMLLLTGCVIIFTLLFTPVYLSWFYKKAVRKFLLDPNNKDVLAKTQLIINDACINEITPSSEVKYKWDAFKNKVENKEYLYLYIHANYALVIPKRILNENEKVQLKFFLSRNLPLTSEFSIK